jgi:uncharacterized membrane protein HdeD (DUF308 family)
MTNTTANELLQARSLRNLYFSRTVIQLIWAGVVLATAVNNSPLAAGLLILYPLWDIACTMYDLRVAKRSNSGPRTAQYVNVALGILATVGIFATVFKSPQQAVVTFGAWACAAGIAQLAVGISRRKALGGGQWAMILSGVQSTAAGLAFIVGALSRKDAHQRPGRLRNLRRSLLSRCRHFIAPEAVPAFNIPCTSQHLTAHI